MRSRFRYSVLFITTLCILGLLPACGTLKNGRGWGQDATLFPGWHSISDAAINAATAPETWAPLAGALILQVGGMDKRLSNYASGHTPVFGSQKAADDAGYVFRDTTRAAYVITMLATPSGDTPEDWAVAKAKGLTVGLAAIESTGLATGILQNVTDRTRPNGSNNTSFPSSLASSTSIYASLASRNLGSLPLDQGSYTAFRIGLFTLSTATAWARVEAKAHFPSDALVGTSLGYFLGIFFNDTFLGLTSTNDIALDVEPSQNGLMIRFMWSF